MNETDMSNIMNQINNMIKNNEIPDDIKNMINTFSNSSNNSDSTSNTSNSNNNPNEENTSSTPDIDINTILKMKQIMDSMNSNKDDPRTNLLMSLKPYLKESRKEKVDQYVKLFGLGKAFEVFGALGGENNKNV